MQTTEEIKDMVREKYRAIALQDKNDNAASCCGASCCSIETANIMTDDYSALEGYTPDADLGLGCGLPTQFAQIKKANGAVSISYTNQIVKPDQRAYLRTLPAHLKVEFQLNHDKLNLLLVHGSPRRVNEYLFEDREEKSLLRIMQDADADIMCFGHTHKPYHRILPSAPDTPHHYRHAINIGSVGKPKDGDTRGGYVLLHINDHSSTSDKDSIRVEFIRFEYDIETAAKAVEGSPLPQAFADALRLAR